MSIARYRALPREAGMEHTITDGVTKLGGRVFSVRDSRRLNVQDMPDLLAIIPAREGRPGIVALIELKSQRRDVTPGQAHVMNMLAGCTELIAGVVRPIPRDGEMSFDEVLYRLGVTKSP